MRSRLFQRGLVSLLLLMSPVAATAAAQDAKIGSIRSIEGTASIVRDGARATAEIGAAVEQGDTLETGRDGALGVVFRDSSTMTLGPSSHFTLDEFVFEPARGEGSFLTTLLRGSVLYVSGVIGKLSRDSVALRTPVATVGMRGTRFLAKVEE